MATTIAISGKGGSGKTTLAAMIIRILSAETQKGVLAVDADPNSCLGRMLGVEPERTVAQLREQARVSKPADSGMDKVRTFEYGIAQAITESRGFDLLTMGRPEGPGCYCAINNLLRDFLDKLSSNYEFVVIDNEAGMEHLSRRTTNNVDLLCIVAEPTVPGKATAERIFNLAGKLPITVKEKGIIWNKLNCSGAEMPQLDGIKTFGRVPYDEMVFAASMQGQTVFDIATDNPAYNVVCKIIENNLSNWKTSVC